MTHSVPVSGRRARAGLDPADRFVHAAVRAFALGAICPVPPEDDSWVERADDAGVLPPVVDAARRSGHVLPRCLDTLRYTAVARHLRTLQDLGELRDALGAADIPWAVLKGPVLSAVVYDRHAVRDYADLDLLVSPSRVRQTVKVLRQGGAQVLPVDWGAVNAARTAELGLQLRNGTVLDLHWSLVNIGARRDGYQLHTDALLRRRVERVIDATTVTTLDDRDLVLHVLLHACLSGCTSLRWLLDVQQCVRWSTCSPTELAARAAELGVTAPARAVLDSVVAHLDPTVTPWAVAMGRPTPWTVLLGAIGRRRPPSAPSIGSRTTRTWYAATRFGVVGSFVAATRMAVLALRYRRSGWPLPDPTPFEEGDDGFQRWLRLAEDEGR